MNKVEFWEALNDMQEEGLLTVCKGKNGPEIALSDEGRLLAASAIEKMLAEEDCSNDLRYALLGLDVSAPGAFDDDNRVCMRKAEITAKAIL